MRKFPVCVLMIPLLLTGCGGAGSRAEETALEIRGTCLSASACTGSAEITADYGQRVYRYQMDFQAGQEETVLTLTGPDTVAGVVARLPNEGESLLEYDGAVLETGPLNEDGLTPVSAIPAVLNAAREGYLETCTLEEREGREELRMLIRDPEQPLGQGLESSLWFDTQTQSLLRAELCQDGFCVIQCQFSQFTME